MGYDLINEPWMGLEWATCLADRLPGVVRDRAAAGDGAGPRGDPRDRPREHRLVGAAAVRRRPEARHLLQPVPGEQQLGLSWHNYCPDVFLESQGVPGGERRELLGLQPATGSSTRSTSRGRMDAVPLMTEWGATDNLRAVDIDAAVADEHLMGWTHWAYKLWNDPTTADDAQGLFRDDADLVHGQAGKLRQLVRTYAQATAGTPLTMRFDTSDGDLPLPLPAGPADHAPRPGSSSARCTTRTATGVRVDDGRVVTRTKRLLLVAAGSSRRGARCASLRPRGT